MKMTVENTEMTVENTEMTVENTLSPLVIQSHNNLIDNELCVENTSNPRSYKYL